MIDGEVELVHSANIGQVGVAGLLHPRPGTVVQHAQPLLHQPLLLPVVVVGCAGCAGCAAACAFDAWRRRGATPSA